jgi:DNA-binding CsgD family transcriptional regulator
LNISSSFLQKLKIIHYKLTGREIEIAALVKEGKSTKEIAERVNISAKTVEFHRNRLREKLGLKKKKVNLRSHLLTIK